MTIVDDLIREEGFKPSAYQDHLGFWTIGHGICIDERKGCGITDEESRYLLRNRTDRIALELDVRIPWWRQLGSRRDALVNMAYQMGVSGVLNFTKMLAAMQRADYETAADEALKSKWAEQTPSRAYRVSQLIRNGD